MIEPHTHLLDGNVRSCHYLLDVLAGRAGLVQLEVQRPSLRSSPGLRGYEVCHGQIVMPIYPQGTPENENADSRQDPDAFRHATQYKHVRARPWVRKLPVKSERARLLEEPSIELVGFLKMLSG